MPDIDRYNENDNKENRFTYQCNNTLESSEYNRILSMNYHLRNIRHSRKNF